MSIEDLIQQTHQEERSLVFSDSHMMIFFR